MYYNISSATCRNNTCFNHHREYDIFTKCITFIEITQIAIHKNRKLFTNELPQPTVRTDKKNFTSLSGSEEWKFIKVNIDNSEDTYQVREFKFHLNE